MSLASAVLVLCTLSLAVSGGAIAAERQATGANAVRVPQGFKVQLLRSAQEGEGSWISMTFEPGGAIIVGLDDRGLGRLQLSAGRSEAKFQHLAQSEPYQHVRGVLAAHDSLYVCATNSQGVYRLRDLNGDGEYETHQLLQHIPYQSRYGHGTNQIVLGPDDHLYVVNGNDVVFPAATATDSPYRNPQNDWLLPSPHDCGHDNRVGYIARVDPEGKSWTVLAGGFRNQFDLAFNAEGEMFTWDADMEWDAGLPWYRPTRLNHVVSGGEYGWRWGSGKWPAWFPDSLPSTLDTGLSSPTGMIFGHPSNWPQRYRGALFMADWQHGRVLLVDLVPRGATYDATSELFLEGAPLNVCDMLFGPDGAFYFITGGRGSQSGLYRVTWTGQADAEPPRAVAGAAVADGERARDLRKRLEVYHRQQDAAAVDFIWQQLGSEDPWLRFAARVALENQPPAQWRHRIGSAADSLAQQTAMVALARVGERSDQRVLVDALSDFGWSDHSGPELLLPLRTLQLTMIRHGRLQEHQRGVLLNKLDPLFPHDSFAVNWLLQELLVVLRAPGMIERSLDLIESAATQEEQIQYAKTLSRVTHGWQHDSLRRVLDWLYRARHAAGGKLVEATWHHLRADFEALLPTEMRAELADGLARLDEPRPEDPQSVLPVRPIVQQWTLEDLIDDVSRMRPEDRSVQQGQHALAAAACLHCHRVGDRGGQTGPDLTYVGRRFDGRALLESIIEPSRHVDPKYLNTTYLLRDGRVVTGRAAGVGKNELNIEVDPMSGRTLTIDRADIEATQLTDVSPMPAGLLDTLTREQVLDLLALLRR